MSVSVCLSVRISKTRCPNFTKFSVVIIMAEVLQLACLCVCLCVCLSICPSVCISQKIIVQFSRNFLYVLSVVMVPSSFDDSGIRYVLPVLWYDVMFSNNGASGPESNTTLCFVKFARWRHWGWSCCLGLQACLFFARCKHHYLSA